MLTIKNQLSRTLILILILASLLIISGASPVLVQSASPAITASPISGPAGTPVTVTGSGFGAGETGIIITFDGSPVTSNITANSAGSWAGIFTVPSSASGSHRIGAYGSTTPASSISGVIFTVINPIISISQTTGPAGTPVSVSGSGFGANETGITVTFDDVPVSTNITANSLGSWIGTFTVPSSTSGSHRVGAYGSITLADFVLSLTFTVVNPSITISPTSGPPGTSITVTGSGFGASETGITITYDDSPVVPGITANSQGNWSGTFTIPASANGYHIISAHGSVTTASYVSGTTFAVKPTITMSKTSGPPGTSVTVTGSGFGANEAGITISFDANAITSGISANSLGNWSGVFIIPASASGSHNVNAFGSTTFAGSVTSISFSVTPTITVSQTSGPPGAAITVTGSGFGTNEGGITITSDGNSVASGISANSLGNWKGTFTVPDSAYGSHSISAYGSTTQAASVTGASFTVTPIITITQTGGPPGSTITVNGFGFGANETGITITYDGNPAATGISANSAGNWSSTFTVPASASGSHSIRAYGLNTQASSIGAINLKVTPSISINPATGYVGGAIVISGFGFVANSPLTITYDNQDIPAVGINTDAAGSFSRSITVPKSKGGNHTINVADWQKNNAGATFSVETTSPPVPALQSPKDGNRLGILGGITPTFLWSGVTDPSGVSYTLEVDTSPDFSNPVLEKTDITANRYTLTAAEALPKGQYYWRVKAIDGAANESSWSQVRLLKSGLMILWTLVLIIVLGVAAVGLGIYFGLIRLRTRKREVIAVSGIEEPQIIPGQWRVIESTETPKERQLPWRLALPEPPKGGKQLSTEDQARLKVIIDFVQSLPLAEPDYNVNWLIDLIETGMGIQVSAQVYEQLLKGQLKVHYDPAWMHHPAYQDLTVLLQNQAILQELNTFVSGVDYCANEASSLLQQIYRDAVSELPQDFLERGGWGFISTVYADVVSWFAGKSLREPSERGYSIKPLGGQGEGIAERWLSGEEGPPIAGELIRATDDKEALQLRALHLRLRRTWRSNEQARQVANMITQIQLQRSRLISTFSQFDQLK